MATPRAAPVLAGLVLAAAGCGAGRGTPPRDGARRADAAEARAYLVWTQERGVPRETAWVVEDPAGHRVLARRPGAVLAAGDELWLWEEVETTLPLIDCEPLYAGDRDARPEVVGEAPARGAAIARLGADRTLPVVVPMVDDRSYGSYEDAVRLLGSVGPLLLVRADREVDACGAHPVRDSRFVLYDLRAGRPLDAFLEPEERAAIEEDEAARAATDLGEALDGDGVAFTGSTDLVALLPAFDPARGTTLEYLFTTEACYACGDGEWGDYSRSTRVQASRLPALLAPFAEPPPAVSAFASTLSEGAVGGFTLVAGEAAQLEILRGTFERAAPPH